MELLESILVDVGFPFWIGVGLDTGLGLLKVGRDALLLGLDDLERCEVERGPGDGGVGGWGVGG